MIDNGDDEDPFRDGAISRRIGSGDDAIRYPAGDERRHQQHGDAAGEQPGAGGEP
jgi:hypothetical protein